MNKKNRFYLYLIMILACFFPKANADFVYAQGKLKQIPTLVHISSTISDGKYTLEKITKTAEENGFKAIVFTDRDFMQWEYGVFPLRNILKKDFRQKSIHDFGFTNYVNQIKELKEKYPELILIPGFETNPFYYWTGSIFGKNFSLHGAHKHMLVFGLENEDDFDQIPVIANRQALFKPFKLKNILNLWPVILLFLGLGLSRIRKRKKIGAGIILLSFFFLINNFPFKDCLFDQYHGNLKVMPEQNLIDYVKEKNGLIFWAHPEAKYEEKSEYVDIITLPHSGDLMQTVNYTGFSVFYEGYKVIGRPGGLWDELLIEFINGRRKTPVWAIGGLAFDTQGDLAMSLKDLRNVLLVDQTNKDAVLNAFRNGNLYVSRGTRSADFVLDEFTVESNNENSPAVNAQTKQSYIGETLSLSGEEVLIKIKGDFKDNNANLSTLRLAVIKNAQIIKNFQTQAPFNIEFRDFLRADEMNSYYRLEIITQDLHVVTNPIFVKRKEYGSTEAL